MIDIERIKLTATAWSKSTPEEKFRIRENSNILKSEVSQLDSLVSPAGYGIKNHSRFYAEMSRSIAINKGFISKDLDDSEMECLLEALELDLLLLSRDPEFLAWNRIYYHFHQALSDPVVKASDEVFGVACTWYEKLFMYSLRPDNPKTPDEEYRNVISNHSSANASKKNAEPRAWVLAEWKIRPDPGQSKASFARQYVPLVKKRFGVLVTEDTIKRDWLPKSAK